MVCGAECFGDEIFTATMRVACGSERVVRGYQVMFINNSNFIDGYYSTNS